MTDRELRFADEYMVDCDAKNAAIRAGYSPATARNAAAWINPKHPEKKKLRDLIDRRMAEMSRRTGITAERVLRELAAIAFVNIDDVVDRKSGRFADDVERCDLAAVAGYTRKKGKTSENKVEFYDKTKALELIGRHLGMFEAGNGAKAETERELTKLDKLLEVITDAAQR